MKTLERPPTLHQSVVHAIKTYLSENDFQPGDPFLPETELAKRLSVSRNSVREAVKALESLGILESRRGIGVFVRDFSFDPIFDNLPYALVQDLKELSELLEVRRVLEIGMIGKVIPKMKSHDVEILESILDRMRLKAEKNRPFGVEDREFHQQLFHHANNGILLKLLDMFWVLFSKTEQYANLEDSFPMQTYQDHVEIVAAVIEGNIQQAQLALDKHYSGISGRLERAKIGESEE